MVLSLNLITMARNTTNNVIFGFKRIFEPMSKQARWRKQAKTLALSKEAVCRLEWFIRHEAEGNASLTCRHFGIAPKTFYKWRAIFSDGSNLRVLESRSKAPRRTRQKEIMPLEERRVIALRKQHIRWGKMKLSRLYRNTFNETISSWKIQYTIQKWKLYYHPKKNALLQQKRKRSQAKKRITELKNNPSRAISSL